ncbi:hypothetical protein [Aeromicrobium sp. NPDC092404]|uniref:hypothetical protein n=1 Tax=Aeromicrobium sp. NPDC092404 TaxID=3154976 RepID=UPI003414677D
MSEPSTSPATDASDHLDDDAVAATTLESTGHADIDAALERLDRLDDLEITSHPEEFDGIHRVLRESLANAGRDGDAPESA